MPEIHIKRYYKIEKIEQFTQALKVKRCVAKLSSYECDRLNVSHVGLGNQLIDFELVDHEPF